jgi:hypothetical protein
MRTVKAAYTEVYHRGCESGTVVFGAADSIAECRQGGVVERTGKWRIRHDSPLPPPADTPEKGVARPAGAAVGRTKRATR